MVREAPSSSPRDTMDAMLDAALAAEAQTLSEEGRVFTVREDGFQCMVLEVPEASAGASIDAFGAQLDESLAIWRRDGTAGVWLKIPTLCCGFLPSAMERGFQPHHAQEEYFQLNLWLQEGPSRLPKHSFTRITAQGVVLNGAGEVLMVQERVSVSSAGLRSGGAWRLPGGRVEPVEEPAAAALRFVREETGVAARSFGIVGVCHSHDHAFGQDDVCFLVKCRPASESEEPTAVAGPELQEARFLGREGIQALLAAPGQPVQEGEVAEDTLRMVCGALDGEVMSDSLLMDSATGELSTHYTCPLAGASAAATSSSAAEATGTASGSLANSRGA